MNFTDLVNGVITETARPDMGLASTGGTGEIPQAVFASTLKMHGCDYFFRDIKRAQIVFDQAGYIQILQTSGIPRYRSIAYLRKNDPSLTASQQNPNILPPLNIGPYGFLYSEKVTMAMLKIISPDDLFDDFGVEKVDVAYQAGDDIYIKSSTNLQYILAGWYEWPNMDTGNLATACPNYKSWIARDYPYCIIYDAASAILQKIGMTDAARKYDTQTGGGLVADHMNNLKISNIQARGY